MADRIWIELEKPRDDAHAQEIVAKANRMLARLTEPDDRLSQFYWNEKRKLYEYGNAMGRATLTDFGDWFSLDYFGRPS